VRILVAVFTLVVALYGCAQPRPLSAAYLPDDFAMSITVLHGPEGSMEPAWYVLGPDNVLHAALGERLPTSTFPPAVRLLSREQVRRVWGLIVDGGLTGEGMAPATDAQAGAPKGAAVMYVAAMGRRRSFLVPEDKREALEPVVAELRRVGWIPETKKAEEPGSESPKEPVPGSVSPSGGDS
jgi:hypothetical protein